MKNFKGDLTFNMSLESKIFDLLCEAIDNISDDLYNTTAEEAIEEKSRQHQDLMRLFYSLRNAFKIIILDLEEIRESRLPERRIPLVNKLIKKCQEYYSQTQSYNITNFLSNSNR